MNKIYSRWTGTQWVCEIVPVKKRWWQPIIRIIKEM
jgi:hypothetical protein